MTPLKVMSIKNS